MKTLKIITLLIIGLVVVYKLTYPTYTYRYRMTVEVNTPEGVKSGSSVIEVTTIQWPKWLSGIFAGKHSDTTAIGEAVFIDLGNGKNIVALLTNGHYAEINSTRKLAERAFFHTKTRGLPSLKVAKELSKMIGEKKVLTGDQIPTIVTFDDLNDPESLSVVYATAVSNYGDDNIPEILDNMETKFGSGFKFKSASIQLVKDDITNTLDNNIPWANSFQECKKAWQKMAFPPPEGMRFHFKRILKIDNKY